MCASSCAASYRDRTALALSRPKTIYGELIEEGHWEKASSVSAATWTRAVITPLFSSSKSRSGIGPNFPRSFFLHPSIVDDPDPIFWRSNASATQIARERSSPRLRWLKEIRNYHSQYFDFPKALGNWRHRCACRGERCGAQQTRSLQKSSGLNFKLTHYQINREFADFGAFRVI